MASRCGGIGLNLTAANHVIHFDRCYNPAKEAQVSEDLFQLSDVRPRTGATASARSGWQLGGTLLKSQRSLKIRVLTHTSLMNLTALGLQFPSNIG